MFHGLQPKHEDALWLSNRDKAKLRGFVDKATAAIESSRLPECR